MPNEFSGMDTDQLIALLSSLGGATGGGLPGKTAASQQNYLQDLLSTLGYTFGEISGNPDPAQADPTQTYQAPVNKQRFIYESDPIYKNMFDLIDQGASPASAVKAAGIRDADQAKEAQKVAIDYAGSVADEMNNKQKFDQANAKAEATFNGKPQKGTHDLMASASEFDLLGQPTTDDLLSQLASQNSKFAPQSQMLSRGPQGRTADATYTTPFQPAGASVTKQLGGGVTTGDGAHFSTPDEQAYAKSMQNHSPTYTTKATAAVPFTSNSSNGPERGFDEPTLQQGRAYIGGDPQHQGAARMAARQRIDKAKSTQVRSDANTNALRRILALRTVLDG